MQKNELFPGVGILLILGSVLQDFFEAWGTISMTFDALETGLAFMIFMAILGGGQIQATHLGRGDLHSGWVHASICQYVFRATRLQTSRLVLRMFTRIISTENMSNRGHLIRDKVNPSQPGAPLMRGRRISG